MADEASTGTAPPDTTTPGAGLFGDEEPSATTEADADEQEAQGANNAEDGPGDAGAESPAEEELKVVVSVRGERAVVGVQRTGADPHIEAFDDRDLPTLTQEVAAVVDRAKARWEESPKHPAHTRPAPAKAAASTKRRQRGGQAQAETPAPQGGTEQPEALRLF